MSKQHRADMCFVVVLQNKQSFPEHEFQFHILYTQFIPDEKK